MFTYLENSRLLRSRRMNRDEADRGGAGETCPAGHFARHASNDVSIAPRHTCSESEAVHGKTNPKFLRYHRSLLLLKASVSAS
jgi:hypothetical protein